MYDVIMKKWVRHGFIFCVIGETLVCILAAWGKFSYYAELLVWAINILYIFLLWFSYKFKIEVCQDNIIFHKPFGRNKKCAFHEIDYYIQIDDKVKVYGNGKILFCFSLMYVNGFKLLKTLMEKGIERKERFQKPFKEQD